MINQTTKLSKGIILASAAAFCVGSSFAAEKRPNILFILTDDQDAATLDVYGDTECSTPNLDRLASEGVALTGAHQMGSFIGAVSTASRTMIMTGRSLWNAEALRNGMNKYKANQGNADIVKSDAPEYYSMPAVFHRAGYETFRTCKRGNSYDAANALFDQRYEKVCRLGDEESGSKWHADNVIKYFDDRNETSLDERAPFLVFLGFSHPHDPRHASEKFLDKYGAKDVETPTEINEKTPSLPISWLPEKPFFDGHPDLRDENKVFGVMDRRDEITIRNEIGKEYGCIENVDDQIGRVLERLEAIGELDNTYIIFTADHGIAVGKHAFMGKQNLNEHTFRVPFIVKGPGVLKNKVKSGNIYLMDVLPTICDLAGIEIPECVDGLSCKTVLMGKTENVRETLYGAYSGGTKPGIRCVKQGDWKLIKYDVMDGEVRETQLFNLKKNPEELIIEHHAEEVVAKTGNKPKSYQVDLAEDPKYAKKLAEMEALLLEQMQLTGDPYPLWNQR
ncbi:MAG: sulfatase-like hydrolase/transferase [Rikenellaceae bacterium]